MIKRGLGAKAFFIGGVDFMLRILVLIFAMAGGAALAQTTGSVNPNLPAPPPAATDDVPPGGCMPIGITAAGDIVFPFQCKSFLDLHRGKDASNALAPPDRKPTIDDTPAASEQKSAARDEAPVEKQPQASAEKQPEPTVEKKPELPVEKQPEAPLQKQSNAAPTDDSRPADIPTKAARSKRAQNEPRERTASSPLCTRFRTYDSDSGTYRDFSGHRHTCR